MEGWERRVRDALVAQHGSLKELDRRNGMPCCGDFWSGLFAPVAVERAGTPPSWPFELAPSAFGGRASGRLVRSTAHDRCRFPHFTFCGPSRWRARPLSRRGACAREQAGRRSASERHGRSLRLLRGASAGVRTITIGQSSVPRRRRGWKAGSRIRHRWRLRGAGSAIGRGWGGAGGSGGRLCRTFSETQALRESQCWEAEWAGGDGGGAPRRSAVGAAGCARG